MILIVDHELKANQMDENTKKDQSKEIFDSKQTVCFNLIESTLIIMRISVIRTNNSNIMALAKCDTQNNQLGFSYNPRVWTNVIGNQFHFPLCKASNMQSNPYILQFHSCGLPLWPSKSKRSTNIVNPNLVGIIIKYLLQFKKKILSFQLTTQVFTFYTVS